MDARFNEMIAVVARGLADWATQNEILGLSDIEVVGATHDLISDDDQLGLLAELNGDLYEFAEAVRDTAWDIRYDLDQKSGVNRVVVRQTEEVSDDFIPPSYWMRLLTYLTPGASRPAIALVGPAGNGKTTAAERACEIIGVDYIVIDANETLEPFDLIGGMSFVRNADGTAHEIWRDGPITKAFRDGKAIIINEFDSLNPRAALCLQSVTQDAGSRGTGRYATLAGNPDEDRVFPHGDCPLVVTMNTYGDGPDREYTGRNTMDAATKDRFTIISTSYENEEAIIRARGYSGNLAEKLARWALDTRTKIARQDLRIILSNRTTLRIAQCIEVYGWNWNDAINSEFYDRIHPDERSLL